MLNLSVLGLAGIAMIVFAVVADYLGHKKQDSPWYYTSVPRE